MRTEITAGQTLDYLNFDLVMADNQPEARVLHADFGYDSVNIRNDQRCARRGAGHPHAQNLEATGRR